MVKTLLWLDDSRDPFDNDVKWYAFSPVLFDEIVWVKSYQEFVDYINNHSLPYVVCFDHDLGEDKTGKDCANYLVEYCLTSGIKLPYYASQSANSIGRENILSLLDNFKMYQTNLNANSETVIDNLQQHHMSTS